MSEPDDGTQNQSPADVARQTPRPRFAPGDPLAYNNAGTAYRKLDDYSRALLAYDAALAEAKTVGLKTPALEAKAKDYIAKEKAKTPVEKTDSKK